MSAQHDSLFINDDCSRRPTLSSYRTLASVGRAKKQVAFAKVGDTGGVERTASVCDIPAKRNGVNGVYEPQRHMAGVAQVVRRNPAEVVVVAAFSEAKQEHAGIDFLP